MINKRLRLILAAVITLLCVFFFCGPKTSVLRDPTTAEELLYNAPTSNEQTDRSGSISESSTKRPRPALTEASHPVSHIVEANQQAWKALIANQSQTLSDAVNTYRRRYGIPPPPNFDRWYKFARSRGVRLIDEYDGIYHDLLPFWGLKPSTTRARMREGFGTELNALIQVSIRNGKIKLVDRADWREDNWQAQATKGMLGGFARFLPDMDIAFNMHDEPRVVVPHDDLARLVRLGRGNMDKLAAARPRNHFTRPADLNNGKAYGAMETTRFNEFAHQATWLPGTLSCPPDSAARDLESESASDNIAAYSTGVLGFVTNQTAFSDVCNSPSLQQTHGAFERPNAFKVVHQLFPIFSQSKLSSYNDILYPSPWYWAGKASYNSTRDMQWSKKQNKLWWVGSSTGGYSRNGGWKRQHRQIMVSKLTARDNAKILHYNASGDWEVVTARRNRYADLIDVHFTNIGQCEAEPDCADMIKKFQPREGTDSQQAWSSKFLLDMDGNAFSGRFYTFLNSRSLPFKMALFREWHSDWVRPWVHYVPMTLKGEEALELVRYFAQDDVGQIQAEELADEGRSWAQEALQKDHLEVWFFRLLLEYGRVLDDNRENIGFMLQ